MEGQDWAGYQSENQSTSGIDFVAIKATEGHTFTNSKVNKQAAHARTTGLQVDFYHFLRDGDMKAQAAYFVKQAPSIDGDGLWAELGGLFDDRERIEIVMLVGHYAMLATALHALRVQPDRPR